jgi:hypothetical protein
MFSEENVMCFWLRPLQRKNLPLLLCLALLAGAPIFAQSTFGTFVGTVQDQSGSVISGAMITITNLDDNSVRSATTNSAGQYQLLNLPSGRYSISVTSNGFGTTKVNDVTLDARQERRVDVSLTLASVQQSVQVSAEAAAINTENATIVNTMTSQEVTELPANYRGASTSPLGAIVASANVQQDQYGNIGLTGSQPFQVDYTVDGTSSVNIFLNAPASNMFPSAEMLGEFKVSAISNNAEFATTGDVTVTTKSGGNTFHGSAFEYLQNAALDATVYGSTQKQAKVWNTFGGSLSGPVVIPHLYNGHDKTFFFIDTELNRHPGSQLIIDNVPTAAMIAGNLNGVPGPPTIDPYTGAPYPNNTIPPCANSTEVGCLNPVAQKLFAKYIPLPNYNSGSTTGDYRSLLKLANETNGYDLRFDQYISSKNLLFGRWTWKNLPQQALTGSGFGGQPQTAQLLPPTTNDEYDKNLIISDNYTITPNIVNEFRFGLSRLNIGKSFPYSGASVVAALGLTGLDLARADDTGAFPGFNFSSGTGFTNLGHDSIGPTDSKVTQYNDNLSWIKGKHTMKFGASLSQVQYDTIDDFGYSDEFGAFSFLGGFSGNAFSDLLLGLPATDQQFITGPYLSQKSKHFAVFAQDEWHVSKSLTFSFGLRWEVQPPFSEVNGNIANFNPANGGLVIPNIALQKLPPSPLVLFAINACSITPLPNPAFPCSPVETASQAGYPQWLRYTDYHDFDPRAGIAWRPFGNDKTVFRAGIGLYTIPNLGWDAYMMTGVAVTAGPLYVNAFNNGQALYTLPATGFPGGATNPSVVGTQSITEVQNEHYKDGTSAQWNVTIERQLWNSWTGRISYIGENTYNLSVNVDLNQCHASPAGPCIKPYPQYGLLVSMENLGFSNYQAMELQLAHRFASGFYLQATYDWSKDLSNLADAPTGYGTEAGNFTSNYLVNDMYALKDDRGNDPGPRRQRFLLTALYQLPFGHGKPFLANSNRFVNAAFGGWQISAILMDQTGPFMTAIDSNPAASAANLNELYRGTIIRPDQIANCNISNPGPNGSWFNLNAFVLTPQGAGRIGNEGVGNCVGPDTNVLSAGLSKSFAIWERLRLRFEATYTNILNHPNFLQPQSMDISSPSTFGVTQTVQSAENGGNRVGQLSLRLDF